MASHDTDAARALAVQGWTTYVQLATRDLDPIHPVDERMMLGLAGEELPLWLEDGIRTRLIAVRGEALVRAAKGLARASG